MGLFDDLIPAAKAPSMSFDDLIPSAVPQSLDDSASELQGLVDQFGEDSPQGRAAARGLGAITGQIQQRGLLDDRDFERDPVSKLDADGSVEVSPRPVERPVPVNMDGIDENPDGVGIGRAFERGVLRTRSTPSFMAATAYATAFQDANRSTSDLIENEFLRSTGLDQVPVGLDVSTPEKAEAVITEMGFPASYRINFNLVYAERIERAARAKANPTHFREGFLRNRKEAQSLLDRAAEIPGSPLNERMKRRMQHDTSVGGTLAAFIEHPLEASAFLGETVFESAPQLGAAAVVGLATRSPSLSAITMGGGIVGQEFGSSVSEYLSEKGVVVKTRADAIALLNDKDLMRDAAQRGMTRSVVIAAFEMLGQGVAARTLMKSPVGEAFVQTAVQAGTGGGGEAAAMVASGQDLNGQEILIEALAETVKAPADIGVAAISQSRKARKTQENIDNFATQQDHDAPTDTGLIADGRASIAEMLTPKAPANVPDGATPLDVLYPTTDTATDRAAPEAAQAPDAGIAPETPVAAPQPAVGAAIQQPTAPGDDVLPVIDGDTVTGENARFNRETNQLEIVTPDAAPVIQGAAPGVDVQKTGPAQPEAKQPVTPQEWANAGAEVVINGKRLEPEQLDVTSTSGQLPGHGDANVPNNAPSAPEQYPNAQAPQTPEPETQEPVAVSVPKPKRLPTNPQKRPVAFELKKRGITVKPGSPAAIELNARDINARSHPGMFSRDGVTDLDNLPATEWQDYRHEIGEDENGYLSQDGIIAALEREVAGDPIQVGEQADLQAAQDAKEAQERFEAADSHPDPINLPDPDTSTFIQRPESDISTPFERTDHIVKSVDAAVSGIGMAGLMPTSKRAQIIESLEQNGGNVEDAVWWHANRSLDNNADPEQIARAQVVEQPSEATGTRGRTPVQGVPEDTGQPSVKREPESGSPVSDAGDKRVDERKAEQIPSVDARGSETATPEITPSFEDFRNAIPKDSDGYPDVIGAGQSAMDEASGTIGTTWDGLTDAQRTAAFQSVGGTEIAPPPATVANRVATVSPTPVQVVKKTSAKLLRKLADVAIKRADGSLNQDRQDNTARRARMAGNAIADATAIKRNAETALGIADATDADTSSPLATVKSLKDIDRIETVLRQAQYKGQRDSGGTYADRQKAGPAGPDDVQHIGKPSVLVRDGSLDDLISAVKGRRGSPTKELQAMKRRGGDSFFHVRGNDVEVLERAIKIARKAKTLDHQGKSLAEDITNYRAQERLFGGDVQGFYDAYFEARSGTTVKVDPVKAARQKLIGNKIPGFFETPEHLANRMVEESGISQGDKVLEPSAGLGRIAAAAAKVAGNENVDVIERQGQLRETLELQNFNIVGEDFMEFDGTGYDAVIMNPPFEKRQDAAHVLHAYDRVKPGGTVVAIMGEGVFFGSDKAAVDFRSWLEDRGGVSEKLPDGTFKESGTGTNTRLVTIPVAEAAKTEQTPAGEQVLAEGITPITQKDRLEQAQAKPLDGGNADMAGGRGDLFGDPLDRADLFDAPQETKSNENKVVDSKPAVKSKPDRKFQRALDMFYSPLLRGIENAKQKQAPAADWKAIIPKMGGIKASEIEWLGVNDWLDAQTGQVTREDLAAFVRDSQIEIVEDRQTEDGFRADGIGEYEAIDALGDEIINEPDPTIDVGEADLPEDSYHEENSEIYEDEAREELDDRVDEDEAAPTDEEVKARAVEISIERYEPDSYSATAYDKESDAAYDGYYSSYDRTFFFPELSDSDMDRDDVMDAVADPIRKAREEQIEAKIDEMQAEHKAQMNAENEGNDYQITGRASFDGYTEGGGDNYREVLLRVPNLHNTGKNKWGESIDSVKSPFVQSGHFDQENIVVHARVKDRVGPNGEKVLFVEEIQSDLASKWRENSEPAEVTAKRREIGGKVDKAFADLKEMIVDSPAVSMGTVVFEGKIVDVDGRAHTIIRAVPLADRNKAKGFQASDVKEGTIEERATAQILLDTPGALESGWAALDARRELLALGTEKTMDPSTPDTPFQQEHTYTLMVKRLLRMAAEGGYDRLSWTPGYMQAERWNNAAQSVVEGVEWRPGENSQRYIQLEMSQGDIKDIYVDSDGLILSPSPEIFQGKNLRELVGPGLAKQVMAEETGNVSGQKITFPDSGYAIAYDQQTKRAVDKLAKKSGARVYSDKTLPDFAYKKASDPSSPMDGGGGDAVWSIDINDALRASAMEPMTVLQKADNGQKADPAKVATFMPKLRKRLKQLGLGHVKLTFDPDMQEQAAVDFSPSGDVEILIGATLDPDASANHEAIHILRNSELFTAKEWAALESEANRFWLKKHDIAGRYSDLSESAQVEEAIAEAFAAYAGRAPNGLIKSAFAKVKRFFKAMREALGAAGITSVEDVFADVDAGRVGKRPGVSEAAGRKEQVQEQKDTDKAVSGDTVNPVTHAVVPDMPLAARKESLLKAIAKQPIDQAFRIPFAVIGGLDKHGRWKIGKKAEAVVRKAITEKTFKKDGSLRFMNPMLDRVRAGLIDRHGQLPEYIERERLRGIEEAAIATKGKEHLQSLLDSGIGPKEAKVLHDILTEGHVAEADMMALAKPIREAIDDLGAEAVEVGLISRESYERNRGTYLHRVYEKHEVDDGRFASWATGVGRNRRRKIIGDQLKGRGVFEQVNIDEIFKANKRLFGGVHAQPKPGDKVLIFDVKSTDGVEIVAKNASLPGITGPEQKLQKRVYWPGNKEVPAYLKDNYDNRGTFEVRGVNKKKVTLWRDFDKAERLKMGEIMDARYTIAKTFALMAEDLATGRFFKDIAENEEWSRATPPEEANVDDDPRLNSNLKRMWIDPSLEWIKVPNSKIPKSDTFRYGALAGRYVRAEIWRDMEELRILQTPNFFKKIVTQWKLAKTARNPVVHMNNVMSNFILMDMADVRITDLVGAISEFATGGAAYTEAAAAGAFGADMVTQELRDNVLKPLLREMRDDIRGRRGVGKFGTGKGALETGFGTIGWIADRIARGFSALDKSMINAYQFEDQLFRLATYMRRRQEGATAEEAAVEARDQFINYDIRAPWINAARSTVLPFLSYTYRAIPKIAQTVAERPWKLAKYFAIYQGLNMLAYAAAPSEWDEEEERGSFGSWESGRSWFGTDHMVRMPYLNKGNPVFLNARRWVPGGDVFDVAGGDIPTWLQIGGPLVIGFELYANKAMFTGDEIFNEITDTYPERMWERSKFLYKSAMPSAPWVPGSWYWDKIARAANGDARQWGNNEPYSLPEAISSSFGLKLKPKDVDVGYMSHEFELSMNDRELGMQKSSLKRQLKRGLITRDIYDESIEALEVKTSRVDDRRQTLKDKRR